MKKNKKVLTVIAAALLAASPIAGTLTSQAPSIATAAKRKPSRSKRSHRRNKRRSTRKRTNRRRRTNRKAARRVRKPAKKTAKKSGLSDTAIAQLFLYEDERGTDVAGNYYVNPAILKKMENEGYYGERAWIKKYGEKNYNKVMNMRSCLVPSKRCNRCLALEEKMAKEKGIYQYLN